MASPKTFVSSANARRQADEHGLLTTRQVAKAAGVTYRQVDYYTTHGYLTPVVPAQGSGSGRLWDPSVLEEIAELQSRVAQCPFCSRDSNRGGHG